MVIKLNYHLVITTKYRRKVINTEIGKLIKQIFCEIQPRYGITLQEIGHEQDHVHILFTASPNSEISKFINVFKSSTSRRIRNAHPEVKEKLWCGKLWSPSYFLVTTGGAPLDVIKKYVQDQGHKKDRQA